MTEREPESSPDRTALTILASVGRRVMNGGPLDGRASISVADPDRTVTVTVRVELKPGVLDAEAESIEKSLNLLGLSEVVSVRTARLYDLDIRAADRSGAERLAATAVDRLLANPVIHRVTVQSNGQ